MPLTPTDVANKQFSRTFPGYHRDEVDAFLDEVESELTRQLRASADGQAQDGSAAPGMAASDAAMPAVAGGGPEAALRTLQLAQRTADEAVAEARAEAAAMLESARTESSATLTAARSEAESTLTGARDESESALAAAREEADATSLAAREEADTTLTAARSEAAQAVTGAREHLDVATAQAAAILAAAEAECERLLVQARRRDEQLMAEMSARRGVALDELSATRTQLESQITDLRAFERDYRDRLKHYLEAQLVRLGDDGPGGDGAPGGVGTTGADGVERSLLAAPLNGSTPLPDGASSLSASSPIDGAIGDRAPGDRAPLDGAPGDGSPGDGTPGDSGPGEGGPVDVGGGSEHRPNSAEAGAEGESVSPGEPVGAHDQDPGDGTAPSVSVPTQGAAQLVLRDLPHGRSTSPFGLRHGRQQSGGGARVDRAIVVPPPDEPAGRPER